MEAVETEVYACISISMGCPELHEYKYLLHRGDASGGNGGPESSGASGLNMQADKECVHMDCLGEECVFRQLLLQLLTVLT